MFNLSPNTNLLPQDPYFMFGVFDPNVSSDSALALGEAILDAQNDDQPIRTLCHIHHAASAATTASGAFMLGMNAEQPIVMASDEPILTLWAADQT
jgi:hypothetical protein